MLYKSHTLILIGYCFAGPSFKKKLTSLTKCYSLRASHNITFNYLFFVVALDVHADFIVYAMTPQPPWWRGIILVFTVMENKAPSFQNQVQQSSANAKDGKYSLDVCITYNDLVFFCRSSTFIFSTTHWLSVLKTCIWLNIANSQIQKKH